MSLDFHNYEEALETLKPVSCDNCATCCKAGRVIIGLDQSEVAELERKGAILVPQGRSKMHVLLGRLSRRAALESRQDFKMANDCPNLLDGKCIVFGQESPSRPVACQEFEVGSLNCREVRFIEGLGEINDYLIPLVESGQETSQDRDILHGVLVAFREQQTNTQSVA